MSEAFDKLVTLFREHGFPITDEAAATLQNLTPVPLEDGGIQIEMHSGDVDLEILVNATGRVEDVYLHMVEPGTEKIVDEKNYENCPACGGSGVTNGWLGKVETCPACRGSGQRGGDK